MYGLTYTLNRNNGTLNGNANKPTYMCLKRYQSQRFYLRLAQYRCLHSSLPSPRTSLPKGSTGGGRAAGSVLVCETSLPCALAAPCLDLAQFYGMAGGWWIEGARCDIPPAGCTCMRPAPAATCSAACGIYVPAASSCTHTT